MTPKLQKVENEKLEETTPRYVEIGDSSMSQVPKKRGIGRESTLLNVLRFGYSLIIEDEKK